MKTRLLVILAALSMCGCSSIPKLQTQLAEFEKLGITEAVVVGKFSSTEYAVTRKDGIRHAEVIHSNTWLSKVKIVRETKE